MNHLRDLSVLVLGLGASGLAMARWCARHGAQVTVADTREAPPQLAQLRAELPQVTFVDGPFSPALVEATPVRAVYRSPGLSPSAVAPVVKAARAAGLVVGGELDLFAQALRDLHATRSESASCTVNPAERAEGADDTDAELAKPKCGPGDEPIGTAEKTFDAKTALESPLPPLPPLSALENEAGPPGVAEQGVAQPDMTRAESAPAEPSSPTEEPASGLALTDAARSDPSLSVAVPAPVSIASDVYVPKAAREAAEFVARLTGLSSPVGPAPVEQESALAPASAVLAAPSRPTGYTPAVLAVTGTNGKTTVTSLTGLLVEHAGKTVAVAGNIGPTLLDTLAAHIDADTLPEVWVLELSSFQLDGVRDFEPTAAAVLNITQDHLDWHGDMDRYAQAKTRIFGRQGLMVLNRDDAAVMVMLSAAGQPPRETDSSGSDDAATRSMGARKPPSAKVKAHKPQLRAHITFGIDVPARPGDFGIERINGMAWLVRAHEADETQKRKRGAAQHEEIHLQRLMPADALRIRGQHNALNALAALALAVSAGCPMGPMLYGLREYRGEPHRVEPVSLIRGVEYFDDSKGTNVGATAAALHGLGVDRKLVVILGGEGKGQDFTPLAAPVQRHARAVVLIGRDAPIIEDALTDTGVPLLHAATLDDAVVAAARHAHAGDAVLLSPACASFDIFRDYAHRAEMFRAAVEALELRDDGAATDPLAIHPVAGSLPS